MYQKTELKGIEQPVVKRLADTALIPFDPANTDYQEYLKWLEAGNTPIAADAALPSDSVADEPTQQE